MSYSINLKQKAIKYRKSGHSIKEVSKKFGIAQGTTSLWIRNVLLNKSAQKRLHERQILGQYKSSQIWKKKRQKNQENINQKAKLTLRNLKLTKNHQKLACSLLFWAEGAKDLNKMKFINSDPRMIKTFLQLFRLSFPLNESKFRALVHIHDYHNDEKIKEYWSKVTKIPLRQFQKSYRKPNTGTRKRENYMGCISINYHDARLARELFAIYNTFSQEL